MSGEVMPKLLRHKVIEELLRSGLIPVFYNNSIDICKNVVKACYEGGSKIVEFTNRGDLAYTVFNQLSRWCNQEIPTMILGSGTINDPATAALYINAGANFIVSPSSNPEVAKVCNRRKVLYIPGCMTPSEISKAEQMGADIIKLFPAIVLTPKFVKSLLGPSPKTQIMASGGVRANRDDIKEWMNAGTVALNIGSDLIRKDLLNEKKYEKIKENVEQCIKWIRQAKEQRGS
jgi:2-dehydro-3-deoxyphosphogluconate aldolase/(4S)-4-hydroxy-2-oxoglutarate aldolase